jgi:hypothetical protein
MNFKLIEPRGWFSLKFFQIIVHGQITKAEEKTLVNIQLRLGWHTFLTFSLICVMAALMIGIAIANGETNEIGRVVSWLLIFPVLGTILLIRKLNAIERKIEDLLGLK